MTMFCRTSDLMATIRTLREENRRKDAEIAALKAEVVELTRLTLQREEMLAAVIRPEVSAMDSRLGSTDSE